MAKWIWIGAEPAPEEYGYFEKRFFSPRSEGTIRIAAETDYVARLNGRLLGFGAFAGWRDEKYYDTYCVKDLDPEGENVLSVTVRYEGLDSAVRINDGAGLWFEVEGICESDSGTLCCADPHYVAHQPRRITGQLGYASDMANAPLPGLFSAVETGRSCRMKPRPVKRCRLKEEVHGKLINEELHLYDLGREETGYLTIKADCERDCTVKVSYGEHISDGRVRSVIGSRDFHLSFSCKKGSNCFTQLFVRLAGRYLEVEAPFDCRVSDIGLLPFEYPVTEKKNPLSGLDGRIYDTCVRTLRLCMHNHYEDCPWREQALYTMDSRNQMLCGYKTFEETEFARANLVLISRGVRPDGLLELTYPAVNTPAIPMFSLMYPVEVWEYIRQTGDVSVTKEVLGTVWGIMEAFAGYVDPVGMIPRLPSPYWNFYEWIDGSDGAGPWQNNAGEQRIYDLILNCVYCYACDAVRHICSAAGEPLPRMEDEKVRKAADAAFRDGNTFVSGTEDRRKTRLGNALACLIGIGDTATVRALMNDDTLMPETLSMSAFVYDAIETLGEEGHAYVVNDIREKYSRMLDRGATSFWETLKGEDDFDGAGSLCHGWSAIPILYLG